MKKLIRDNIPDIMKRLGIECNYYYADKDEFKQRLKDKLLEECNELIEALDDGNEADIESEFADIDEVLLALMFEYKIREENIHSMFKKKQAERGSFDKHIIGIFPDR